MYLGSFAIDDYVGIPAATHRFSTGAAYAPTSLTYSIYEEATAVGIDEDVDMVVASPFDSIVGCYWIRRQLTTAAGFEAGKNYLVVVKATVDSVAAIQMHTFQVLAKVDARAVDGVALISHPAGMFPTGDTLLTGTAGGGSVSTITLTGGVATNGYYNGCLAVITSGTGAGQSRTILSYVGSTTVATITRNWVTAPDATSKFVVLGSDVPEMLDSGTAQAGAGGTITLHTGASAIDDTYNDNVIFISSGTGAGQSRQITDYDGTSKIANITPPWTTNPNSTSCYQIIPGGRVDVGRWLGTVPLALSSQKVQTSLDATETAAVADKLLGRSIQGGADGTRTVTSAFRKLRNKWAVNAGTLTVYQEDDTTPDHTEALTTDAAANPVTASDPA